MAVAHAATAVRAQNWRTFFIVPLSNEGNSSALERHVSINSLLLLARNNPWVGNHSGACAKSIQLVSDCARRCNSSKNAWMSGVNLPGQSAASVTGENPSKGTARIPGDSLDRGMATDKPMP